MVFGDVYEFQLTMRPVLYCSVSDGHYIDHMNYKHLLSVNVIMSENKNHHAKH